MILAFVLLTDALFQPHPPADALVVEQGSARLGFRVGGQGDQLGLYRGFGRLRLVVVPVGAKESRVRCRLGVPPTLDQAPVDGRSGQHLGVGIPRVRFFAGDSPPGVWTSLVSHQRAGTCQAALVRLDAAGAMPRRPAGRRWR